MDSLLARQLRKHLPSVDPTEPQWAAFLAAVEGAYVEMRNDRKFLEHTLETTSHELTEANEKIRRDAENRLAALSQYYLQTLELQQGMIQCVRKTERGFEYTLCRGELLQRLGLRTEDVEGHLVNDVIPSPERARELNYAYERAWAGEEFSAPYISSGGLDLFILMRPRYEKGVVCEIIASFVEITALKQTERELIAAKERAEAADNAKTEFLGVMSHELRTPLNAVLGFSDLLMASALSAEQQGWLSKVSRSSEALLDLLNNILDFSRIEAGKCELHPESTPLRAVLDEIVAAYVPAANDKGVSIVVDAADDVPGEVIVDRSRLQQVLTCLVSNAVKFTETGSVRFAVSAIPPAAGSAQGRLQFAVIDTGIGIPENRRDRLFKPFSQVDSSNTRVYGGSGLGLAIADRVVRIMGGEIAVDSVVGLGSTFSFCIPAGFVAPCVLTPPALPAETPDTLAVIPPPPRILVAEDHARSRELMGLMLDSRGYPADLVSNGRLAVEAAIGGAYDLIFMDLQMPELDGLSATTAILKDVPAWRRPKIYGMGGDGSRDDDARCREVGMEGVLPKPINFARVFSLVSESSVPQVP